MLLANLVKEKIWENKQKNLGVLIDKHLKFDKYT